MPDSFLKDPDAVLDYKFDFSSWLVSGETIAAFDITESGCSIGDGATVVSTTVGDVTPAAPVKTDTDTSVTVWVYALTVGANVSCRVRTTDGRVDDRTMTFQTHSS